MNHAWTTEDPVLQELALAVGELLSALAKQEYGKQPTAMTMRQLLARSENEVV